MFNAVCFPFYSKRKLDDAAKPSAAAGSSKSKRAKKEKEAEDSTSKDDKKRKQQMEELFKHRDAVKDYARKDLLHILTYNKQDISTAEVS